MLIQNGVASFPQLFNATTVPGSDRSRYGVQILITPDHPQLNELWQEVEAKKAEGFPSGMPNGATCCFGRYEDQVNRNKDYYDPRFNGWWMLSAYSPGDKPRPACVMENATGGLENVMDPSKPYSGELMDFHVSIYSFKEGRGGVACGLNGVRITGQDGPMGRLDNRPTAEQMFGRPMASNGSPTANLGTSQRNGPPQSNGPGPAPTTAAPGPAPRAAPPPPGATRAPAPPPAPPVKQMTPKAQAEGYSYDLLKQAGWTDQAMIAEGYLVPPAVTPSFQ